MGLRRTACGRLLFLALLQASGPVKAVRLREEPTEYVAAWPEVCSEQTLQSQLHRESCSAPDLEQTSPPLGRQLHKKRHRLKALCRETRWIYQNHPGIPYTHMTSLAMLPDNKTIMAAWQASEAEEGHTTQHLMTAISHNSGRLWVRRRKLTLQAPPYRTASTASGGLWFQDGTSRKAAGDSRAYPHVRGLPGHEERPMWGPALFTDGGGLGPGEAPDPKLWLFFSSSRLCWKSVNSSTPDYWTPGGDLLAVHSPDGHSWSNPEALLRHPVPGPKGGTPFVTANSPVVTHNGSWVLPFWGEGPKGSVCEWTSRAERAGVLISADRGETWVASKPIKVNRTWLIEGTVVAFEDGELLQLFRTTRGYIYQSRSFDGGMTWTEPNSTDIPNPNSKVATLVLSNGEVVLAYNAHNRNQGYPASSRALLFLTSSSTRGRTWSDLAHLEMGMAKGLRYHYPAMLQVGCKLIVSYTVGWKEGFKPLRRKGHIGSPTGIKVQILHLGLKGGTHGPSTVLVGGAEKQSHEDAAAVAAAAVGSLEAPIRIGFHVGSSGRGGAAGSG